MKLYCAALIVAAALTGCSQEDRDKATREVKKDTAEAQRELKQAGHEASKELDKAGKELHREVGGDKK